MTDAAAATSRRRGRPPATDSSDTRRVVLDTARQLFAGRGYDSVTNKEIADAAGLTTGALYHYFESKLDLYVAVEADVRHTIYGTFQKALASGSTFLSKFEALLDAAADLTDADPTFATFVGTVRVDSRRDAELGSRLAAAEHEREQFFVRIVDVGVSTGEIAPDCAALMADFIRTILAGLTDGVPTATPGSRSSIDAIKSLLRGELITPLAEDR